ncbi:MAG TPA: cysteine dioxygenase family protein [Pyrinomonadaceae bacterium]|nr:cysteine dioxygenase family protein [Pyrinomonadaceae bacterium]
MSTHIETTEEIESSDIKHQSFSFQALVETLEAQNAVPQLEQIYDWLRNVEITDDELAPYIGFKEGNYWRHRVFRNDFIEMLVLCWRPGHRTPIHDHNGSHGGVRVQQGRLWETIFHYDEAKGLQYKTARELPTGAVTGSDIPDIHQLGNPDVSEQNLVTIHVYAPPLGVLHTYKPGSVTIELYVPDESETTNA